MFLTSVAAMPLVVEPTTQWPDRKGVFIYSYGLPLMQIMAKRLPTRDEHVGLEVV